MGGGLTSAVLAVSVFFSVLLLVSFVPEPLLVVLFFVVGWCVSSVLALWAFACCSLCWVLAFWLIKLVVQKKKKSFLSNPSS